MKFENFKLAGLLLLIACSNPPVTTPTLEIAAVTELGVVGKPVSVLARDGGNTALIGGKLLWTFGDTLFNPKSVDGTNLRSNTAALADPNSPLVVNEPLDVNGAPSQFLPFTPEEKAYNDSSGTPSDRIALWGGDILLDSSGNGSLFYLKLKVKPGVLNYEFLGVGLAHVTHNATTATREPNLLFTASEPIFTTAMQIGTDVFLYGNLGAQGVMLAKVDAAHINTRGLYSFWNGSSWVANLNQALGVMPRVPGLSVSYNPYLQQYLAVSSGILSNKVYFRTSSRPEGPWSSPLEVFTGQTPPSGSIDYAALEHPELAKDGGKTLFITYYHPLGGFSGELRAVEVKLK